ncbi:MAG: choice-of-anchor Q domain-containing protein, partial [Planctomycetia bacterium]|nr:choice-of-anchor Q domain-containing protein [Planctomycetia bacterium]
ISEAATTTASDLIVLRTTSTQNTITYAAQSDELTISIDATQFGSVTIVSLGTDADNNSIPLTLDAAQLSRVMTVSGSTTKVNLGGLTITGGKTSSSGGGIYNKSYSTLTVTNSTIAGNSASDGGGIYSYGTLTVTNSTISGNKASDYGGGIYNSSGTLTVTNSTISGNSASWDGGGIYNRYGTLTVTNSTISGNSADDGGGICNGNTLNLYNSIVSLNYAKNGATNISGTYSGDHNLVGGYNPLFVIAPVFDEDGVLTNAETMDLHLRSNSPAINGGDNSYVKDSSKDMDGNARIYDGTADIGAYEYQDDRNDDPIPSVVDTLNDSFDLTDDEWSLREAIYWAAEYVTITFAEELEGTITLALGELVVDKALTIDGAGKITLDANQLSRVMKTSGEVFLDGLIITGGLVSGSSRVYGGGIYNEGSLTISNCCIINNIINSNVQMYSSTSAFGGGIYNTGNLNIISSHVSNNSAKANMDSPSAKGGGIYSNNGEVYILKSSINANTIYADGYAYACSNGGGVYIEQGNLRIVESQISSNIAKAEDGTYNVTMLLGGVGLCNSKGKVVINSSKINANYSDFCGTGYYHNGTTYGIGINNQSGFMEIIDSEITGNRYSSRNLVYGGGINNDGGTLTITNSTISENTASRDGGGIYNNGTVNVYNTLIVCNTSNDGADIAGGGTINGYNSLSSYTEWGGENNYVYDPSLPLFRNIENGDFRLLPDSQAAEKGNNQYAFNAGMDETWLDLSGSPRFVGENIDIGAYESSGLEVSQNTVYVGEVTFSWKQYKNTSNVKLTWISGTKTNILGTFVSAGEHTWDTTAFQDGYGQLKIEYLDENGKTILSSVQSALILNDENIVVHRGTVQTDETWVADKTHLVVGGLNVAGGATLTIGSETIVKFWKNAYLNTESGASIVVGENVIFTRVEDDEVGGDTNKDGSLSTPKDGNAYVRGAGAYDLTNVTMKYVTQTCSGTLSQNETWLGGQVYRITGTLTVPSGVTLTILPGAILKFDSGCSLIVQSGGSLVAEGNVAQPIVFTSVNDDSYGGDTNEDEGESEPQAGDWNQIRSDGGTIRLSHTRVRYCSNTREQGGLYATGGSIEFNNSVIEFTKYESVRIPGGSFSAYNSVFRETSIAFGYYSGSGVRVVNCVVDGATVAYRYGSGKTFINTIFSNITSQFCDQGGDSATFQNCVFWNPQGTGPQSYAKTGSNGNIWANPLFRDAKNGDYRLQAGSPCIDAGDGTVATATDITGAPRYSDPYITPTGTPNAEGEYVDIGAYEFTETASSSIDLTPVDIQAPKDATTGESVTIQWTIRNDGSAPAVGVWTDEIYLISETGQKVVVGEVTHTGNIAAGDLQTFYAEVTVPNVKNGNWTFGVSVNPNRQIFEGTATDNNVLQAKNQTSVSVPELILSDSFAVSKNGEMYKLTIPANEEYYLCYSYTTKNAQNNIALTARENTLPTDVYYDYMASTRSKTVFQVVNIDHYENQAILYIPRSDQERTVYLSVDTSHENVTGKLERVNAGFAVYGFSRSIVSSISTSPWTSVQFGEQSSITLLGTGFTEGMTAVLNHVPGPIQLPGMTDWESIVGTVRIVSPTQAVLTFDMDVENPLSAAYAQSYDLVISNNGASTTLAQSVRAEAIKNASYTTIAASLEIPDSVRSGRIYKGYIVYENISSREWYVPVFTIRGASGTPVGLTEDSLVAGEGIHLLGTGSQTPGLLAPGESGRVPFYFQAGGGTQISLSSWVNDATTTPMFESEYWDTWAEFHQDLSAAVNQLAARNYHTCDYDYVVSFLNAQKSGEATTGLSGFLRYPDSDTPLANCTIQASWVVDAGTEQEYTQYETVSTDEDGFYVFNYLPQNAEITLELVSGAYGLSQTSLTLTDNRDITNHILTALPFGSLTGRILDVQKRSASDVAVLAQSTAGNTYLAVTDSRGYYTFDTLPLGEYTVSVQTEGRYQKIESRTVNVFSANVTANCVFNVNSGTIISGTISDEIGLCVGNALVTVIDSTGQTASAHTDMNGYYCISGMTSGKVSLTVHAVEYTTITIPEVFIPSNENTTVLNYTMTLDSPSYFLTDVYQNTLEEVITSAEDVVLTISGYWGDEADYITLIDDAGREYVSTEIVSIDNQYLNAYFSSAEIIPGNYSVQLTTKSGVTATLDVPFVKHAGMNTSSWVYSVTSDTSLNKNRSCVINFSYTNIGDTPVVAPVVSFSVKQFNQRGGFLTLDYDRYQSFEYSNHSELPEGFDHTLMFIADGANAGMIMPGETTSVSIYYVGWLTDYWNENFPVQFVVEPQWFDSNATIDWKKELFSLDTEDNFTGYDAFITYLNETVGNSWGEYIVALETIASKYDFPNSRLGYSDLKDVFTYYYFDLWKTSQEILQETHLRLQQATSSTTVISQLDSSQEGTDRRKETLESSLDSTKKITINLPQTPIISSIYQPYYEAGTIFFYQGNHSWDFATKNNVQTSQETYVIIHGWNAGIDNSAWMTEMADALRTQKPNANILAVDWKILSSTLKEMKYELYLDDSEASLAVLLTNIMNKLDPATPASRIPKVAELVYDNLKELGLNFETTSLIGHSHGAHVSGLIGNLTGGAIRQITALDASEELSHIFSKNSFGQSWGKSSAQYVTFYKSSRLAGGETATWGHDNFLLVRKDDIYGEINLNLQITEDHSFSYIWYIYSIIANKTNAPGFTWNANSWNETVSGLGNINDGNWNAVIVSNPETTEWHFEGLNIPNEDDINDEDPNGNKYDISKWKYPGEWNIKSNSTSSMNELLKSIRKSVELTYSVNSMSESVKTSQVTSLVLQVTDNSNICSITGREENRLPYGTLEFEWIISNEFGKSIKGKTSGVLNANTGTVELSIPIPSKRDLVAAGFTLSGDYYKTTLKLKATNVSGEGDFWELYPDNDEVSTELKIVPGKIHVNAGEDKTIYLSKMDIVAAYSYFDRYSANVSILGSCTLEDDEKIYGYKWSGTCPWQTWGPGKQENPTDQTELPGYFAILSPGEYQFTLTVYDAEGLPYSDTMKLTVKMKEDKEDDPPEDDPKDRDNSDEPQSCDPNEINGPVGYDFVTVDTGTEEEPFLVITSPNWVAGDATKEQEFKIYFENKSSATAAAQEVFVTTTLPEELDWSTFELQEICIGNQVFDEMVGEMDGVWTVNQTSTGDQIKISVTYDEETGLAQWYLRSWVASTADHFPASAYEGFLPPNNKEVHDGEGYVAFAIRMDENLTTGTKIETNASIVFDTNDPIVTNTWVTTIDADKPVAEITSVTPGENGLEVAWDGSDVGCGIAAWGVFVSINGAEEIHWKTFDAETKSVIYRTSNNTDTYEFRVEAVDHVRLAEIPSVTSDSDVTMVLQKTSNTYSAEGATDVIPVSVTEVTDWDSFYGEIWSEGENVQAAGSVVTVTVTYNPKLFEVRELRNVPVGITGVISEGVRGADGNVTVEVMFTVGESGFEANGANTFWGAVFFVPAVAQGAGIADLGTSEKVGIQAAGQDLQTQVQGMPYDLDRNGQVNVFDLVSFLESYGRKASEAGEEFLPDYDGDGRVNVMDLLSFLENYGMKKTQAELSPEVNTVSEQNSAAVQEVIFSDDLEFLEETLPEVPVLQSADAPVSVAAQSVEVNWNLFAETVGELAVPEILSVTARSEDSATIKWKSVPE